MNLEKLQHWAVLSQQLKTIKEAEMSLRKELFGEAFPNPEEGTQYYPLSGGWRLQGRYKMERNIEVAQLGYMRDELARRFNVGMDPLLNWKAELSLTNYRALSDEARGFFDNVLIMKPGSPQLTLIPPTDEQAAPEPKQESVPVEKVDTQTGEVTVVEVPIKKKTRPRKKAAS